MRKRNERCESETKVREHAKGGAVRVLFGKVLNGALSRFFPFSGFELELRVLFGKVLNGAPDKPLLPLYRVLGANDLGSEAAVVVEQLKRICLGLDLVVEIEQT